jgi:hypothetical protein
VLQKLQNGGYRVLWRKADRIRVGIIALRGILSWLGSGGLLVRGVIHTDLFGLRLLPLASTAHQLVDARREAV